MQAALDRLVMFIKGRCMETKVAGKIVSSMCRSAAKVNKTIVLKFLKTKDKFLCFFHFEGKLNKKCEFILLGNSEVLIFISEF